MTVERNFSLENCKRCGGSMPNDSEWQECDKCITTVYPET